MDENRKADEVKRVDEIPEEFAKFKASSGFFMRRSRMPSIMCFSMILLYYGGHEAIRMLLCSLARGGR